MGSSSLWLLWIVYSWTFAVELKRVPRCFQVLASSAASSTITALSPGGALMQGGTQQAINRTCSPPVAIPLPKSALRQFEKSAKVVVVFLWNISGICVLFLCIQILKHT